MNKSIVITVINNLIVSRNLIFDQLLTIAMETDFKHLANTFEKGEIYTFELDHFLNAKNDSLNRLAQLCKELEGTIFSLMNTNGVDENEVNFE